MKKFGCFEEILKKNFGKTAGKFRGNFEDVGNKLHEFFLKNADKILKNSKNCKKIFGEFCGN